jgi:hypothetical protein
VVIVYTAYVGAAAVGLLIGVLTLATFLHGRAWVWAQTRAAWRDAARRRARRGSLVGEWLPASPDQPVAVAPRGGWLR